MQQDRIKRNCRMLTDYMILPMPVPLFIINYEERVTFPLGNTK